MLNKMKTKQRSKEKENQKQEAKKASQTSRPKFEKVLQNVSQQL